MTTDSRTTSATPGTAVGTSDQPAAPSRLRTILVLGALVALGPLTIDVYLPALPAITEDLGSTDAAVQFTLTGTLIGLAVGQLVIGPLSDSLGRRRPLIAGTMIHIVASLLCMIAPTVGVLGVTRALQGFGAAAAMVIAIAIVRDLFDGRAAATVMSRLVLVMGVAPIVAPSLGSLVLIHGSWRGVFAGLAVVGAALMLVAMFLLKETLPEERRRPNEFLPVLRTYGSLLGDRRFVVLVLVAGLGMSALFAYISGSSFVLQDGYGLGEQQFALVFGIGAVALISASQLNVLALQRFTPQRIVTVALVAMAASGAALIVTTTTGFGGIVGFMVPVLFVLASAGFVMPNSPALALSRHGEAAGTAAALLGAAQFGIGALIAPLVGVLGNDGPAMAIAMTGGATIALLALASVRSEKPVLADAV
ncbi:multidrug effflux MFS transporter [Rhodococcus sp. BP-149]|uniref:multidrug effflux MFS transporter n=1 Tax=unclassified Rhodococcus (in: high G+C Gram-positive bacteria) TaxID=192944 RepID=UPI001C9A2E36|nr:MULTISPECIES: multidrug effflux MFS transporter [unclassified Rhodococcus (in: high G+C Gram-positive bacteria)]MBY6684603.1 multidrug effflux MFS transporter [Rhodococcus sp. BP-288]MBY6695430.1 multidrug effflux MFS transporter [Rhodococcus sp. BP-188]MBY6698811.1 multidrug effflux MFS transporter [Rhodococcus sp. BP-285]MBY6701490.1 multidrug effflux MFS transporter [Rhodococcus sp. BP-283]MBY6712491.1 multidrug effflux MFS transporter [Rhodococcus sp. BP-160]